MERLEQAERADQRDTENPGDLDDDFLFWTFSTELSSGYPALNFVWKQNVD